MLVGVLTHALVCASDIPQTSLQADGSFVIYKSSGEVADLVKQGTPRQSVTLGGQSCNLSYGLNSAGKKTILLSVPGSAVSPVILDLGKTGSLSLPNRPFESLWKRIIRWRKSTAIPRTLSASRRFPQCHGKRPSRQVPLRHRHRQPQNSLRAPLLPCLWPPRKTLHPFCLQPPHPPRPPLNRLLSQIHRLRLFLLRVLPSRCPPLALHPPPPWERLPRIPHPH